MIGRCAIGRDVAQELEVRRDVTTAESQAIFEGI